MKTNRTMAIVMSGMIAFAGVIAMQVYWLKKSYSQESQKLSQQIQVALLSVAKRINTHYGYQTPLVNPVQKMTDDYYVVNLHNDFEARILEFYLVNEFASKALNTDFEYAIYDCESGRMMYGNYVNMHQTSTDKKPAYFAPVKNLVYYFSIRIPNQYSYIFASLKWWILLCVLMLLVLLIYLYAIAVIWQQKRHVELQKDFINNMTHEFKTPLASMLIAANYLGKQTAVEQDEKLKKYTNILLDQGKKLNAHVEKLLNLAKHDAAPMELTKSTVVLQPLLEEAIQQIHLKYDASILIENDVPDVTIQADAFHLSNVVYNLLDNAIKYAHQHPEIHISVKREAQQLLLRFQDNGKGIPPAYRKLIFEKFYRVPSADSNQVMGFGLGLYYVKQICSLHHWKCQILDAPNGGTLFQISIRL